MNEGIKVEGWAKGLNPTTEVRVTDPTTGGQKGSKLARFSLIPAEFLWALATHYGIGAQKYEDRNWERGYKWSLSVDALERHLNQWKLGENLDVETGSHHLIAVAWHACALFVFGKRGLGTDDVRPVPGFATPKPLPTAFQPSQGMGQIGASGPWCSPTSPSTQGSGGSGATHQQVRSNNGE